MATYILCFTDGAIQSVRRSEVPKDEGELRADLPEGGFFVDLTGMKSYEKLELSDILTGYKVDVKTKKLIKLKAMDAE